MDIEEAKAFLASGNSWVRWKDGGSEKHLSRGRLIGIIGDKGQVHPIHHKRVELHPLRLMSPWRSRNEAGPFSSISREVKDMYSDDNWVIVDKHNCTFYMGPGRGFNFDLSIAQRYDIAAGAARAKGRIVHSKWALKSEHDFAIMTEEDAQSFFDNYHQTVAQEQSPKEVVKQVTDVVDIAASAEAAATAESTEVIAINQKGYISISSLSDPLVHGKIKALSLALDNLETAKIMLLDAKNEVEKAHKALGSGIENDLVEVEKLLS